jgi:dienelactone hydrolase
MPEKSALSLQVIEEVDCGRFVRRKISYLVEAEERVNAYLCLPKNDRRPLPAVFCHHQHNSNWSLGKSEVVGLAGSPDQAYAKELAEQGYITLSPDAICFEERAHKEDPRGYHSWQLNQRLIIGETLLGKTLWDISVGIDLLIGLPEVDENRIGFIGHSYGGRSALFAPVYDRRLKAAVSSCGCTSFQNMIKHDLGIQYDFVVPGLLNYGDLADVVRMIEPASLLLLGTDQDKWSLGLKDLYEETKSSFVEGTFDSQLYPGGHQFSEPMRQQAYQFMDEQLKALA